MGDEPVAKRPRGRPRGTDKRKIGVWVPETLLERVIERAEAENTGISDVVRGALAGAFPASGKEVAATVAEKE